MKRLTIAALSLASIHGFAQVTPIRGMFTDEYVVMDTTDLAYGKRISDGIKGDSCLILGYVKSSTGSVWYKVATLDTIGYTLSDFVAFDKLHYKVHPVNSLNSTDNYSNQLVGSREEWNKKKQASRKEAQIANEKKTEEFKKFISKSDLLIVEHSFPETEYLHYPSFKATIFNPKENKIIKYIWFTITAWNPVNDIIGTKTVQAIGPVLPLKLANYEFESIFISKVVDVCKITNIKIQYMDGSILILNSSQIQTVITRSIIFLEYLKDLGT